MMRPIAIDLFSGAGGLSLGFEQAGFDVAAAVEIDPIHAAVHEFNFPICATLCKSASLVSGSEIREAARLGTRKVDVLIGGAPCQGFSLIGHRVLDDPRNSLVKDFVRLVSELDANYFVFENVKGLTVGRHKSFLNELISSFDEKGYSVCLPWQVLNAADFGVPQNRERLILIGAKRGLPLPAYPDVSTERVTCKDALDDLPDADAFAELMATDELLFETVVVDGLSQFAREMRGLSNRVWHYGYARKWNPRLLTSSMRTHHSEISRKRFLRTLEGNVEPISRFFKLPADGVSNTLRAGTDGARGAFTSPRPIHYKFDRCVTVREMARLHGFPDWFRFHETKWHGARQIGNAVAPPMARAVGEAVIGALGVEPQVPNLVLELGDTRLLRMNMGEAAEHWDIAKPVSRRDRKSGARKRSQAQVELELRQPDGAAIE
jgi:DNA (cytosine-5)-methyltransferase 1